MGSAGNTTWLSSGVGITQASPWTLSRRGRPRETSPKPPLITMLRSQCKSQRAQRCCGSQSSTQWPSHLQAPIHVATGRGERRSVYSRNRIPAIQFYLSYHPPSACLESRLAYLACSHRCVCGRVKELSDTFEGWSTDMFAFLLKLLLER